MKLYSYFSICPLQDKPVQFTIGKRSWDNISPDKLIFTPLKDELLQVEWKKYKFVLYPDNRVGYWKDGFTGCEYDGFDKKRVDIDNQHMLECAYEVLEELETLIEKRGLYGDC